MTKDLIERLRGAIQKLRKTSMPIADVAPMLSQAADAIESLQAENERLKERTQKLLDDCNTWAQEVKKERRLSFRAERDALAAKNDDLQRLYENTMVNFRQLEGKLRLCEEEKLEDMRRIAKLETIKTNLVNQAKTLAAKLVTLEADAERLRNSKIEIWKKTKGVWTLQNEDAAKESQHEDA